MRFFELGSLFPLLLSLLGNGIFSVAVAAAAGPAQGAVASEKPQIVANLYAKNVEATLGLVKDYLPVPIKPEAALLDLLGDFGGQVALSAPVAALVGVDAAAGGGKDDGPSQPLWVFSVGVRNLDEAQKLAQGRGYVTDGKPGALRLRLGTGNRALFCLLSGASGSSGRLSCGPKERARDLLAPYVSRPSAPTQTSDVHAEILVDALLAAYDSSWRYALRVLSVVAPTRLKLNEPTFDRALTDVTQALIEQLQAMGQDLQTVSLDLTLTKLGIELSLAYRLVGQSAWWAQAEAQPAMLKGAPPVFFNLPADSSAASFQANDAKWAKKIFDLLLPLLDGFLTHEGLAAAERKAVSDVFNKVLDASRSGPLLTVIASGKTEQPPSAPTGGYDLSALLGGSYYLVAAEGANEWTVPWLKSLVATYNRPGLQNYLRTRWKKFDPTGPLPSLKVEPVPKTLPAGGYAMVLSGNIAALLRDANKAPAKPRPVALHLITIPSEGRVWTAMGSDKAALVQRLTEATKQPAKTLASRAGLEALREPGVRSGGFTSLVALSSYLDALLLGASSARTVLASSAPKPERPISSAQLFTVAPHHGEVPMIYLSKAGPGEASGRTAEFILRVPRMVIEDVAALVMQLALEK